MSGAIQTATIGTNCSVAACTVPSSRARCQALLTRANPGKALLLSASADLHGSFNGNWFGTGCSSELRSGPVKVKSAAVARSFAQRLLFFSG